MKTEELREKLQKLYSKRYKSIQKRVTHALEAAQLDVDQLSAEEVATVAETLIEKETETLSKELEELIAQKEALERKIEKKSDELQEIKYEVFNSIEEEFKDSHNALLTLHQIKLQSIDLYDILSEMVESAIITALEKDTDGDIREATKEVIKEITFEAIKEGPLNTIRVRKILSTILATALEVAEATPTRADEILHATLKGMRAGLFAAIERFKKRLAFMPVEAKHILIEDYDTIIEDLNQTDTLFSQVIITQAQESNPSLRTILLDINNEMKYDLDELVHLSKETAEVMREKFSSFAKLAVKKADSALQSPKAQEAKKMGMQAFSVAKEALENALKNARSSIDKK
jgi:hypothetical protein